MGLGDDLKPIGYLFTSQMCRCVYPDKCSCPPEARKPVLAAWWEHLEDTGTVWDHEDACTFDEWLRSSEYADENRDEEEPDDR